MEYIFLFTYSVIVAVIAGVILAAIVALFSRERKFKRFKMTLCYTTIVVSAAIFLMTLINL